MTWKQNVFQQGPLYESVNQLWTHFEIEKQNKNFTNTYIF